jgi:hypothetical protein
MPCLNEARTVGRCIDKALDALAGLEVAGEVVIADNGSTDGSTDIARAHGARVVHVERKGYGSALQGGIRAARGCYIVMGDADDSYDFSHLDAFVERLRAGDDLVMGNRFRGGIRSGAMPWLHRYVGNPVLTGILNLFFRTPVGDAHCGLRAFRKDACERLDLVSPGMEFASEMVVKAALHKQRISEVPTVLYPDGRDRPPHLRSFRDGWRHLRFLLLMCPYWLYLVPGLLLCLSGLGLMAWQTAGPRPLGGFALIGCLGLVLGYQILWLWAYARLHQWSRGLIPGQRPPMGWFPFLPLESGLILGGALLVAGAALNAGLWLTSWDPHLASVDLARTLPYALWGSTLMICGMQTIFGSFFLGMLRMEKSTEL